jgi:hypothetical protein
MLYKLLTYSCDFKIIVLSLVDLHLLSLTKIIF